MRNSNQFLIENGMHEDCIDFGESVNRFIAHMKAGLKGQNSSLMMLPTYINLSSNFPRNETVLAIDAGGTNLRIAKIIIDEDGQLLKLYHKKYPMPGTKETLTAEEFFDKLAEYIAPIAGDCDKIGFCFSFPSEILPNHDAKIISFTKEVRITGAENMLIGENLNKALAKSGCSPKKIAILNDTVATMLGGALSHTEKTFSNYIGLIIGTGTNMCYCEKTSRIEKIDKTDMPNMVINTESCGYNGFDQGVSDRQLDQLTKNPGVHCFEKMVSGAYFGPLVLLTLKHAASQGLFTTRCSENITGLQTLTAFDVDCFLSKPTSDSTLSDCCSKESDREMIYALCDALYNRAAKALAVTLYSVLIVYGKTSCDCPVGIVAEGSMFYKAYRFRERLEKRLKEKCDKEQLYYEFISADDPNILGSVAAALM